MTLMPENKLNEFPCNSNSLHNQRIGRKGRLDLT